MKRYYLGSVPEDPYSHLEVPAMLESEDGEWVRHSDVKELINKLVEEGRKIAEKYDEWGRNYGINSHEQQYWDDIVSEVEDLTKLNPEPDVKDGHRYVGTDKDGFHHVEIDNKSNQYSDASVKVINALCECRDKKPIELSARKDVLQRIWSRIVTDTLDRQHAARNNTEKVSDSFLILDEEYVDGTIFQICNDYEKQLEIVVGLEKIMKAEAFEIISKNLDDFRKAINFCRYEIMSINGRRRFNFMKLGEE